MAAKDTTKNTDAAAQAAADAAAQAAKDAEAQATADAAAQAAADAAALVAANAPVATFPRTVEIVNQTPVTLNEPETGTDVPAYSSVEVTVKSADQLARAVSNCEAINQLGNWDSGFLIKE
jgi:hypothetical protein